MEWWVILLIVIGSLVLLTFLIFLLTGYIFFKTAFKRDNKPSQKLVSPDKKYRVEFDDEWVEKGDFKLVRTTSEDNLILVGHLAKNDFSHNYALFFHGYRGDWRELTMQGHDIYSLGFSTLFVEERGHGQSGGECLTFGCKERDDVKSWCKFILSMDKDAKILLFGLSMGASSVMMSLDNDLPIQVKAAITDCGYSSIPKELKYILSKTKLPLNFTYLSGKYFCWLSKKFSFTKYQPTKSLSNSNIPILMIHGETDTFVPYYMLDENFSSVKQGTYKQKESFPIAWHALSYQVDRPRYQNIVKTFVAKFF